MSTRIILFSATAFLYPVSKSSHTRVLGGTGILRSVLGELSAMLAGVAAVLSLTGAGSLTATAVWVLQAQRAMAI
jgi:hypothetical protein